MLADSLLYDFVMLISGGAFGLSGSLFLFIRKGSINGLILGSESGKCLLYYFFNFKEKMNDIENLVS